MSTFALLRRRRAVPLAGLVLLVFAVCGRDRPRVGEGLARLPEHPGRALLSRALAARGLELPIADWGRELSPDLSRDVEQAMAFARDPTVLVVVGHAGSRASLLAARTYNAVGLPQLVPNATGTALSRAGRYTLPLAPSNAEQAELLLSFATDTLGAHSISLVYVGDTYGADLYAQLDSLMRGGGRALSTRTLVTGRECVNGDRSAARAMARAHLARAHSDIVIIATSVASGNCFADELLAASDSVTLLFSDSGSPEDEAKAWSAEERARVWRLVLWHPDTTATSRRFAALADSVIGHAPMAQDAFNHDAYLLAATALASGVRARREMHDWLLSLGRSRPPIEGLTGPLHFHGRRAHRMRVLPVLAGGP